MVTRAFEIAGRRIGGGARCFVIAEAGVNHNGKRELAFALVDAAAKAGADAVKFQTFDPSALASASAPKAEYQKARSEGASQREMLEALTLPREVYVELKRHAEAQGLVFMSSPFDEGSARFLAGLDVPAFKIASGELTNHPFLRLIAGWRKPMLVSTGMATLDEVRGALEAIREAGDPPVALFHCVSSYPATAADANLRAMGTLRETFGVASGWSDHMLGIHLSTAAVALGAEILEKHLTLDRSLPGPDHAASTEPAEFGAMIAQLRDIEASLGSGVKQPVPAELGVAAVARKSLHFAADLPRGTVLTEAHLVALRPGTGVPPSAQRAMLGRRLAKDVRAGAMLAEQDLETAP